MSLSGAKWLLLSNIFQKLFTFGINQIIIRQSSPEIFGIAAIQLELLLSTLLFLSREGIRMTLIRTILKDSELLRQQVINLSWIPSLILIIVSGIFYLYCPVDVAGMSREVVLLYCLGAVFESFGEPWINMYNNQSQLAPRARADAIAVTVRSLTTLLCVVYLKMGVLGFGIAQAAYGLSHFSSIIITSLPPFTSWSTFKSFFPAPPGGQESLFHLPSVHIALQMTGTSILKHFLTEGDRIVLSLSVNHYNQGIYAVTYNYGSLVARLLFQPIEESCRITFAQIAGRINHLQSTSAPSQDTLSLVSDLRKSIYKLLRFMILFGSVFPIFGPFYARLLVKIILGPKWYSEETILSISMFCFYLFVMGCNGVSEAFVQSVAQTSLFGTMNQSLFLSFLVFYTTSPFLISTYGTVGIIMANSLSMILRILFNLHFISNYFTQHLPDSSSSSFTSTLSHIFPSLVENSLSILVIGLLYSSSLRFTASPMTLVDAAYHVALGAILFLFLMAYYGYNHRQEVKELLQGRARPRTEKTDKKPKDD